MAAAKSYRMPSFAWSDGGFDSKPIPNHDDLVRLSLILAAQYDTGAAPVRYREGFLDQLIQTLVLRRGSTTYAKLRGQDWHFLHQLLQKEPHGLTQTTATAAQSNQTVGSPVQLALDIPVPKAPDGDKALLEVTWGGGTQLGADYTIDSASLNGQFIFAPTPPAALRCVPFAGMAGKTGDSNQVDIPFEGQLVAALVIMRANASPFAVRDPTGALVEARIEGDQVFSDDWRVAKSNYKEFCNLPSLQTGVGLLFFDQLPLVRNSSIMSFDIDATSTDISVYGLFTAGAGVARQRETMQDVLRASGASQAPDKGSLATAPKLAAASGSRIRARPNPALR